PFPHEPLAPGQTDRRRQPVALTFLIGDDQQDVGRFVAGARVGVRHCVTGQPPNPSMMPVSPLGLCSPNASCSSTPSPSRLPHRARITCCTWMFHGSTLSSSSTLCSSLPTASSPCQWPCPHSGCV